MLEIKEHYSPMIKHYCNLKNQNEDCVLFYRLGDFYELFFNDAVEISRVLDLTLTSKSGGNKEQVPMCGVPYHAADSYIAKLVGKGYKVAICEQLTEPTKGQKIVDRDIVRVITAGTVTEESMLEGDKNNYIMCLYHKNNALFIAYSDILTGEVHLTSFSDDLETNFSNLYSRIEPSQVIGNDEARVFYNNLSLQNAGSMPKFEEYYDYAFNLSKDVENIKTQFGGNAVTVFELKNEGEKVVVGALLEYLFETQKRSIKNINKIISHRKDNFLNLDFNTRRNLEIVEAIRDKKRYGSLLWLLDKTKTSMGARLFRTYLDQPLKDSAVINFRLDGVEEFTKNLIMRDRVKEALNEIYDIERLSGKIGYGNATPRDLMSLGISLNALPKLKEALISVKSKCLLKLLNGIGDFSTVTDLLKRAIMDNPPVSTREGGYIANNFNDDLDKIRDAKKHSKERVKELEKKEREKTNIKNLKISFNSVFGYYIEVSKLQAELVPLRYIRKQTLTSAERYTTRELQELEEVVINADEKEVKLEDKIYKTLMEYLTNFISNFQEVSKIVAEIDCLLSLAECAVKYNYSRPTINKNVKEIKIVKGRHPVVERFVKNGNFISNDTLLDNDENIMMIITGPNMAGKSTYMRQVAIITFMAHIGSFVPAESAEIPITDRIFTRVGASDDLAFGQSTFMVEMSEVALILANATEKSLVVLDEIGRGTSTFDGLSIAWAVVEYIAKNIKCKTLFATHYHELSELEGVLHGVKNYKSTVKETGDSVVFLRKIVRGHANKSFGVEVAKLAGVPDKVLDRANEISRNLERVNQKLDLDIFSENEERERAEKNNKLGQKLLSILKDIDMNRMSPMESFEVLNDLTKTAKGE